MTRATDALRRLSARDRRILREQVVGKIAQLRGYTTFDGWERTFAAEAGRMRVRANGVESFSDAHDEYIGWAHAYEFLLLDAEEGRL